MSDKEVTVKEWANEYATYEAVGGEAAWAIKRVSGGWVLRIGNREHVFTDSAKLAQFLKDKAEAL